MTVTAVSSVAELEIAVAHANPGGTTAWTAKQGPYLAPASAAAAA